MKKSVLGLFGAHLIRTCPQFCRNLLPVLAAWIGYFGVLKGVLLPLVLSSSDHQLIAFAEELAPLTFWVSVAITVVTVIYSSVFSAWPTTISFFGTFVLMVAQFILRLAYGLELVIYGFVVTAVSAAIFYMSYSLALKNSRH